MKRPREGHNNEVGRRFRELLVTWAICLNGLMQMSEAECSPSPGRLPARANLSRNILAWAVRSEI
jgi:hypothetical protein